VNPVHTRRSSNLLRRKVSLWAAKPAHRTRIRTVGVSDERMNSHIWNAIGAGNHLRQQPANCRSVRSERAGIQVDRRVEGDQRAITLRPNLDPELGRMPLGMRQE